MRTCSWAFCDRLQNIRLVVWLVTAQYAYPLSNGPTLRVSPFGSGRRWRSIFRLLGAGKRFQTAAQLSDALFSWNWLGLGIAVLGGFTLFATAAVGYIDNPAFRLKLGVLLPLALTWHIFVQQKSRTWGRTPERPRWPSSRA